MEKKKKIIPPYTFDIISIVVCFVIMGLTIYTSFGRIAYAPLIFFYAFIGILRLIMLLFKIRIDRSGETLARKFVRERRILRLTGLAIFLVNLLIYGALVILIYRGISNLYYKFDWAIYVYMGFAMYKFISSIVLLTNARESYSPYREAICSLSFISALMTFLSLEVAIVAIYDSANLGWRIVEILTAIGITGVILLLSILMMIARRVPKEIRNQ